MRPLSTSANDVTVRVRPTPVDIALIRIRPHTRTERRIRNAHRRHTIPHQDPGLGGRFAIRLAAWGAVAGIDIELDDTDVGRRTTAMLRRDWLGAADAFGEVGWPYDRALMLSLLDDEESLVEAIEIARRLGAGPLTRRVARRMRELGMSVPQGPRESTRANPAGLTARQLEVLTLLAGGLTNAEIADRLVVSPRTAEHHVAAVLTKLGAATRRDAARRASELGLVQPEKPS